MLRAQTRVLHGASVEFGTPEKLSVPTSPFLSSAPLNVLRASYMVGGKPTRTFSMHLYLQRCADNPESGMRPSCLV